MPLASKISCVSQLIHDIQQSNEIHVGSCKLRKGPPNSRCLTAYPSGANGAGRLGQGPHTSQCLRLLHRGEGSATVPSPLHAVPQAQGSPDGLIQPMLTNQVKLGTMLVKTGKEATVGCKNQASRSLSNNTSATQWTMF